MGGMAVDVALRKAERYAHAVVSFVGDDGYPIGVGAEFRVLREGAVEVGPLTAGALPRDGQEVNLTFSQIRPMPGMGYDRRRYVSVWGPAVVMWDRVLVRPERASGWDEAETPFFEYCERSVPRGRRYLAGVGARPRLGLGWLILLATRLPFLTATIVPIALGAAVAASHGAFDWSLLWLTLAGGSALHLGLNIANDLFDDASGADAANVTPTPFSGGSRVIQYGLVSRRAMLATCLGLYGAGVGIGIWLAETRGAWLYPIGIAGIVVSLAYTAPPLRLVHRGLGEGAVALGFGPITTLGAYYVMAQRLSWEALYASLPVAILIALVLYVNEIPDRAGDAAAGKRTLVVRWPKRRVVAAYHRSATAAYALVVAGVAGGILPGWALMALATVPMAIRVSRGIDRHYESPYELMPAMQANITLHLATGALLVGAYLLAVHV